MWFEELEAPSPSKAVKRSPKSWWRVGKGKCKGRMKSSEVCPKAGWAKWNEAFTLVREPEAPECREWGTKDRNEGAEGMATLNWYIFSKGKLCLFFNSEMKP